MPITPNFEMQFLAVLCNLSRVSRLNMRHLSVVFRTTEGASLSAQTLSNELQERQLVLI